jgi:hypothetical protein
MAYLSLLAFYFIHYNYIMLATPHVLVGGTVGIIVAQSTNNPVLAGVLALGAGIASHLICDAIPHFDVPLNAKYKNDKLDEIIWTKWIYTYAFADSLLAFLLTLFLWNQHFGFPHLTPYAIGAFGAYLPDLLDVAPFWRYQVRRLPLLKQFHKLHQDLHNSWRFRFPMKRYWPLGIVTQLVAIGLSLTYLL